MSSLQSEQKSIAIVEDDEGDVNVMLSYIDRYRKESTAELETAVFLSGMDFLEEYKPIYDIIFMDIDMPHLDGINTARLLRRIDPYVGLVFVTNMAQYAIKGYEVSALDFIVKPVSYFNFKEKLEKYLLRLARDRSNAPTIVLDTGASSFHKVSVSEIFYIIKDKNYLVYTTAEGEFRVRGTMRGAEETFKGTPIVKCANGCMVNLAHVRKKVRNTVFIGDMQFNVTAPHQEEFTRAMMAYLRGGGGVS